MVVSDKSIHNIMGGMESTAGVRLHNHRRKLKQRFDIIKKLGQGTYGKVQLGINKETGQEVAIKTIKKAKIETEADLVRIRREIQIMSSVQHPNIIHIYEVFENREKMVLVMEHAAGGELYDYLSEKKVLTEDEARRIFRQIATAVYYCHKHKICHRDLKLENILLDEHKSAKIADFGLSNVFDDHRLLSTFCGSPLYASPEIVKGTPYIGPEVDCWSLGVLLYTLVYGAMPFDGSNFKRLVKQISNGDYFEPKKPSAASPLIRDLLTVAPAQRATIEKVCSHWWVNETYTDSCLDIAEELANQTPVRLDLLLSLAPPPPEVGSDKLLVGSENDLHSDSVPSNPVPVRSLSVGSLMELDHSSIDNSSQNLELDKRRSSVGTADVKEPSKRKLEGGMSTEDAARGGAKRKEVKKDRDRSTSRRRHRSGSRSKDTPDDKKPPEAEKSVLNETKSELMDVDLHRTSTNDIASNQLQNAVDSTAVQNDKTASEPASIAATTNKTELSAEAEVSVETLQADKSKPVTKDKVTRKSVKGTKKPKSATEPVTSETPTSEKPEGVTNSNASSKKIAAENDSVKDTSIVENDTMKVKKKKKKVKEDGTVVTGNEKESVSKKDDNKDVKTPEQNGCKDQDELVVDNFVKQGDENSGITKSDTKVLDPPSIEDTSKDKSEVKRGSVKAKKPKDLNISKNTTVEKSLSPEEAVPPSRPVERRRSKIFETYEKFFAGENDVKSPTSEKPKKVFIPGVKVSDYKQAFERKSSLTNSSLPTPVKSSASKKSVTANKESKPSSPDNEVDNKVKNNEAVNKVKKEEVKADDVRTSPVRSATQTICVGEKEGNKDIPASKSTGKVENVQPETRDVNKEEGSLKLVPALEVQDKASQQEEAKVKKIKDAVEIISNAISEESKKGLDQKKVAVAKPPVPLATDKSKTKLNSVKSPPGSPVDVTSGKKTVHVQVGPNDIRRATIQVSTPESVKYPQFTGTKKTENTEVPDKEVSSVPLSQVPTEEEPQPKKKSSKVEITLKSATLPRRKSSKAEIKLDYPGNHIPPVEYKTEVSHMVGGATLPIKSQKSEVAFPVAAASPLPVRSASVEPEGMPAKKQQKPREHIIPIRFEDDARETSDVTSPPVTSQARPPVPPLQQQRSQSQGKSISRQSTQDSDTDSTISVGPEPIRKSPREFIIPIAVEGGGYITPRAGSLEPSEVSSEQSSKFQTRSFGKSSKTRRMSSLLSDASEDEGFNSIGSPFSTLQRHSSLNKDSDKQEEDSPFRHMHKLRSSKPSHYSIDHNDSLSSAEEDEDDEDGFELLTAENLFSTLLSRVRNLTQRLNVEDGIRPGFPTSRLMSHLSSTGHTPSPFFSSIYGDSPSSRSSERSQFSRGFSREGSSDLSSADWRRPVNRDQLRTNSLLSEASSVLGGPRGSKKEENNISEKIETDNSSTINPHCFTPSLARRLRQNYQGQASTSESENVPNNLYSNVDMTQSLSDSNFRSPTKLSRTLSQISGNSYDESRKSSFQPLSRKSSFLDTKTTHGPDYSHNSLAVSNPEDYSYRKKYYVPTRRTLSMLDADSRYSHHLPAHRGNVMSDIGEYYSSRHNDKRYEREPILPPLPYVQSTKRNVPLSKSYLSQDSNFPDKYSSDTESSAKQQDQEDLILKELQSYLDSNSSKPVVPQNSSLKNNVTSEKQENVNLSYLDTKKIDSSIGLSASRRNMSVDGLSNLVSSSLTSSLNEPSRRNVRNSHIPSLLRFRSSSVTRDAEKAASLNITSKKESPDKELKNITSTRSTPERSILSKFFRHGSEEKNTEETKEAKEKKKSGNSSRRISRFLRPDFFDTPREESEYAKQKDAKKKSDAKAKKLSEAEEKNVVKAEAKKKVVEDAQVDSGLKNACAKVDSKTATILSEQITTGVSGKQKDIEVSKLSENKLLGTEVSSIERSKCETKSKSNSDQKEKRSKVKKKEIKSKDENSNNRVDKKLVSENKIQDEVNPVTSDIKNLESGVTKEEPKTTTIDKQVSPGVKNRLLCSLEKKLGKIRSLGNDRTSVSNKNRIDSAIRSLREKSLDPGDSNICTESNLIKRAVSVDDCTSAAVKNSLKGNASSGKLNSKVNSVLGLFRKLEDSSEPQIKKSPSNKRPTSMVIPSNHRMQLAYLGSHSDSTLTPPENKDVSNKNAITNHDKILMKPSVSTSNNLNSQNENKNTTITDKESFKKGDLQILNLPSLNLDMKQAIGNKESSENWSNHEAEKILTADKDTVSQGNIPNPVTLKPEILPTSQISNTNNLNKVIQRPTSLKGVVELPSLNLNMTKLDPINFNGNNGNSSEIDQLQIKNSPVSQLINKQLQPPAPLNLSVVSTPDESLLSPVDDSESHSLDSWSVCSEIDDQDSVSSPFLISLQEDDAQESVSDRIRRKSFYTRFNDIKRRHRKSSSSLNSPLRDPFNNIFPIHNSSHSKKNKSDLYGGKSKIPKSNQCNEDLNSDVEYIQQNGFDNEDSQPKDKSSEASTTANSSEASNTASENNNIGESCENGNDVLSGMVTRSPYSPRYYRRHEPDTDYYDLRRHYDLPGISDSHRTHLSRPIDFLNDRRKSSVTSSGLYGASYLSPSWNGMTLSTDHLGLNLSPRSSYLNSLSRCRSSGGDMTYGKFNRYKSRNPTDSSLLGAYGSASESSP